MKSSAVLKIAKKKFEKHVYLNEYTFMFLLC
jgi:hypothetical protein